MDHFTHTCRRHGLKITPQRTAIYNFLKDAKTHPSADQVHKKLKGTFPHMSLDTVNRTLLTFADIGIIQVLEGQGDPRRFDPDLSEHHHFYCLGCRQIFDFHSNALTHFSPSEELPGDFTITHQRICLTGYCPHCKKDIPNNPPNLKGETQWPA